ncbi:MAG TPA: SPW repeat protein [Microvirga sp.]|nr:SPW repeat protein [Microvirga sp.]
MLKGRTELTAINIVNAVLAAFLFVSPWLFGFSGAQAASWNAWICGLAVAVLALAAVKDLHEWEEWANLALGLWTLAAPWILGFAGIAAALWTHAGIGLAVAVLAAVELWLLRASPPTKTA